MDKALDWLRLLKEQQIGMVKKYQLERMPPIDGRGGFSSYRIVLIMKRMILSSGKNIRRMMVHLYGYIQEIIFSEKNTDKIFV